MLTINDVFGYLAGDAVLGEVARRIDVLLRPCDSSGRYGGEELIVVLPACDGIAATKVAERIRACIAEKPVVTEFGAIAISFSIGIAVLDGGKDGFLANLIEDADKALYKAKGAGRNRVGLSLEPIRTTSVLPCSGPHVTD